MKKFYYRPDIDGLRTFAIIPVLFFHLGIAGFSGGFIGVDIFFVISGYLISSIIIRELDENRFSFIQFWERRVRRIFPILTFVLFTTVIASYFITIFPPDFIEYGKTLATQSLFLVNIFFMRTNDYFAAPTETIPLLHTWSLAVEEQFYIILPILLFLIHRYARRWLKMTLIILGLLSLSYSVYLVNINPLTHFSLPFIPHIWGGASNLAAGFYFPLARAWELTMGVLIAVYAWKIDNRKVAEVVSASGLVLIMLSIHFIDETTHAFPGLLALAPILGTMAIIIANTKHPTFVAQILAFPVLVWIGLISYSLYLWHWPLIVFTKQYVNGPLTQTQTSLILVATFVLSILSYLFIETPFRKKAILGKRWQIFSLAGVSIVLFIATGVYITKQKGLPERAPEAARAIAVSTSDRNPREYECFRNNYKQIIGETPPCLIGNQSPEIKPTFVLWGDSHADASMPVFDALALANNKQGVFFAVGGCSPLITSASLSNDPQCIVHNKKAPAYIIEHKISTVFIVSSWQNNYPHTNDDGAHSIEQALIETLSQIPTSTKIILMQRVPTQNDFKVRQLFYTALKTKTIPNITVNLATHNHDTADSRLAIETLSKERANIEYIDPNEIFCDQTDCFLVQNGKIIYTDQNHLNATGAHLLAPLLEPYLKE